MAIHLVLVLGSLVTAAARAAILVVGCITLQLDPAAVLLDPSWIQLFDRPGRNFE